MGLVVKGTLIRAIPNQVAPDISLAHDEIMLFGLIGSQILYEDLLTIADKSEDVIEPLLIRLQNKGLIELDETSSFSINRPSEKRGAAETKTILDLLIEDEKNADIASIPREEREAILLFFDSLPQKNFYELLGVERSAETAEIKLAFVSLSRKYHPDRYYEHPTAGSRDQLEKVHYQRPIGHYRNKLETIFRQINLAYRTLKDSKKRGEYDSCLPPPDMSKAESEASTMKKSRPKRTSGWLIRMAKADNHFKQGIKDLQEGNILSAHSNFTLAATFIPDNKEFQDKLKSIEGLVKEKKAENIIKRAEEKWSGLDKEGAIAAFEEALELAPQSWRVNFSYGRVLASLESSQHLDKARILCENAARKQPGELEIHCALAEIYEKLELTKEAKQEMKIIKKLSSQRGKDDGLASKLTGRFKRFFQDDH